MAHQPYIRQIPGSREAVVMIHGILGTPDHFRDFIPLIPESHSVYNILLDGHGKGVSDFSRTSMKRWKAQVTALLDDVLKRHESVILVAHSMGTLFSIAESVKRPEKIRQLFLLQTPLRPRLKFRYACYAAAMPFGILPKAAVDMRNGTSVGLDIRLWKYIGWLPRFLELFRECAATRKILDQICVPCRIYQCRDDEMVSMRTCKDLQKHPHLQIAMLTESGHFAYYGADRERLLSDFAELFQTE